MDTPKLPSTIRWRVHTRSPPERVYTALSTDEGRARFWAKSATETEGVIHFEFPNGLTHRGRILEKEPPDRFVVQYFGGSRVVFKLAPDGEGGTDLSMTESDVPRANRLDNLPGWIPVLLGLKAAVDFGVDLRNHSTHRSWDAGYVDG